MIEASLFEHLDNFPRILPKDYDLQQELADLLLEIESAKNEGYLQGVLLTRHFIIENLPHNLQESGTIKGSKYKKEQLGQYPPFSYFIEFVNSQMK